MDSETGRSIITVEELWCDGEVRGPVAVKINVDGTIAAIEDMAAGTKCDAHAMSAGFVDIHIHGFGGADDVQDYWLNPSYTLRAAVAFGTTAMLASIVFDGAVPERTAAIIRSLEARCAAPVSGEAVLEGIHAEGPVVADLGGLPQGERDISLDDFKKMLDTMPHLRVMTISPSTEAATGYARIQELLRRGVVPSLGHDRTATEEQILGALRCCNGDQRMHLTHLLNVTTFHHRTVSLSNFGLAPSFPNLPSYAGAQPPTIELLGDFAHVHPLVLSNVLAARSPRDVAFVTDAVAECCCQHETLRYGSRELEVGPTAQDGVYLKGTKTLAGSNSNMLAIFHALTGTLMVPPPRAVQMLAETPARIAKLSHAGLVQVGRRADLLLWRRRESAAPGASAWELAETIVAGKTAWCASN